MHAVESRSRSQELMNAVHSTGTRVSARQRRRTLERDGYANAGLVKSIKISHGPSEQEKEREREGERMRSDEAAINIGHLVAISSETHAFRIVFRAACSRLFLRASHLHARMHTRRMIYGKDGFGCGHSPTKPHPRSCCSGIVRQINNQARG